MIPEHLKGNDMFHRRNGVVARGLFLALVLLIPAARASAQVPVMCTPNRMPVGGVASVPGGVWRCINIEPSPPPPSAPRVAPPFDPEAITRPLRKSLEDMQRALQQEALEEQQRARAAREGIRELHPFGPDTSASLATESVIIRAPRRPMPAGEAVDVTQPAFLVRGRSVLPLQAGVDLFEGDLITAEGDGHADVQWPDGSRMRLEATGVFGRVEFRLAATPSPLFDLVKGRLRWITGQGVADKAIRFATNFFAVAIRGTDFTMSSDEAGSDAVGTVSVASGLVLVFDYAGRCDAIAAGDSRTVRHPIPTPLSRTDPLYVPMTTGQRAVAGTRLFSPMSPAGVWLNTSVWRPEWEDADSYSRRFVSRNGKLIGNLSMEPRSLSPDELAESALATARAQSADAQFLSREQRQSGGVVVTSFRIGLAEGDQRFVFTGHYFSGAQGTVRLAVIATEDTTRVHQRDINEFLDSLVVLNPHSLPQAPATVAEMKTAAEAAERTGRLTWALELYGRALDGIRKAAPRQLNEFFSDKDPLNRFFGGDSDKPAAIDPSARQVDEGKIRERMAALAAQMGQTISADAPANDSSLGLVLGINAEVLEVRPGSVAEQARFRVDDVILFLNAQAVKNSDEIRLMLGRLSKGALCLVVIQRGDERLAFVFMKP